MQSVIRFGITSSVNILRIFFDLNLDSKSSDSKRSLRAHISILLFNTTLKNFTADIDFSSFASIAKSFTKFVLDNASNFKLTAYDKVTGLPVHGDSLTLALEHCHVADTDCISDFSTQLSTSRFHSELGNPYQDSSELTQIIQGRTQQRLAILLEDHPPNHPLVLNEFSNVIDSDIDPAVAVNMLSESLQNNANAKLSKIRSTLDSGLKGDVLTNLLKSSPGKLRNISAMLHLSEEKAIDRIDATVKNMLQRFNKGPQMKALVVSCIVDAVGSAFNNLNQTATIMDMCASRADKDAERFDYGSIRRAEVGNVDKKKTFINKITEEDTKELIGFMEQLRKEVGTKVDVQKLPESEKKRLENLIDNVKNETISKIRGIEFKYDESTLRLVKPLFDKVTKKSQMQGDSQELCQHLLRGLNGLNPEDSVVKLVNSQGNPLTDLELTELSNIIVEDRNLRGKVITLSDMAKELLSHKIVNKPATNVQTFKFSQFKEVMSEIGHQTETNLSK